jgi:hypothetical protein
MNLICKICQIPMKPYALVASNGRQRYICRNRECDRFGRTSVERSLPKAAEVLQQCKAVFPSLKWELLQSDHNRVQFWARTKHFTVEILVLREIGVQCYLSERPHGKHIRCDRPEGKDGQPVKEALVELRKRIEKYGCEIQEVLREKL